MSARSLRLGILLLLGLSVAALAQVNPSLYAGLRWRDIGPHHGGRIAAVSGAIGHGQAGVFYAGLPQGGLEKTTNAGVTWAPVFDQFKNVDSVGAVQVAPSDPDIVYAGTGDSVGGSLGDGMYKSTDAGKTWTHIGLADTVKINTILISPTDPNVVLASTQGDDTHNGRGVFRSTDGGQTWTNVLDPKGYNGTRDIAYAFDMPNVIFATAQGTGSPFRFGPPPKNAPKPLPAALYKSTDGGVTWTQITSLPDYPGRIGVAVAMHTNAQRVYVVGNDINHGSGLYRSDDGGQTWRHMDVHDLRIANGQGNYSCGVYVDSQNPDILYTMATAVYQSTDGGNSFHPFKGAPGGEDAHPMWIDPTNGHRLIEGMDQGASITLDGGATWSTYYNQPVAQLYHLVTTNQYPFWVLASQQDTGAVMVRNRSDYGEINHDWHPLDSSEFGRLAVSPTNPEIVYGVGYGPGGGGSGMIKINLANGQWQNVAPNFGVNADRYHQGRDFAKHFDTAFDPNALYVAYQCLMVSTDGAHSWRAFSPDLTTEQGEPQIPCGAPEPGVKTSGPSNPFAPRGNSINDFSISTAKRGVFWSVSSNGQIFNTMDGGKHWNNVTNIPDAKGVEFLNIQASHQNPEEAYIAGRIGGQRGQATPAGVDPNVPLIWRTTDGGKTWTKIVNGLPKDQRSESWVNVVREDPDQAGLLFAGTESSVYVSFDDGNHWESLQLNMPTTSIRDLKFHTFDHENDIVIATYGRGIWVLDDYSPLRQIAANTAAVTATPAYLFQPGDAIRSRENTNWDQPTEPWENYAPNPPYGAAIYYHLNQAPSGPITLSIYDAKGGLVNTISSTLPPPITNADYPDYWLATPASRALSTHIGTNRFVWNLLYAAPPAFRQDLENQMNSVEGETTPGPKGPQVIPGQYTVKLTVDGHTYTRTLTVLNDPRVGQSPEVMAALRAQNRLNLLAYHAMETSYQGRAEAAKAQKQLTALEKTSLPGNVASQAKALETKLAAVAGKVETGGFFFRRGPAPKPGALRSFVDDNNNFNALVSMVQVGLDMAPTPSQVSTWETDCRQYNQTVTAWNQLQMKDLVAFNQLLNQNHLPPIAVSASPMADPSCSFK